MGDWEKDVTPLGRRVAFTPPSGNVLAPTAEVGTVSTMNDYLAKKDPLITRLVTQAAKSQVCPDTHRKKD